MWDLLSSHLRQRSSQFLRGAKQRVLGGLFGVVQHLTERPQLQSLIMLQFKNNALAWSQLIERFLDPAAQFAPHQVALWICSRPNVRNLRQHIVLLALRIRGDWSVFFPHLSLADAVQAQVRDDPVNQSVEGTFKTEAADVLVGL